MFAEIDKKKKIIAEKRPLPKNTLKSIREKLFLDWTYNSNAIEGNTLTLSETKVVLEDGITIGGKTLKEHLEVVNHKEAIIYMEDIIKENQSLSERQIKNIHYLILKGIDDQNAGRYRKEKVVISGAEHTPPDPIIVPGRMEELINWYHETGQKLHTVERAAKLHTDFVRIHPFIDGNGRTARLLLNFELIKDGYPVAIIKNEDRVKYYQSLDRAHVTENYDDFIELVAKALNRSLDLYLKLID
ncbi:Fic family protein [Fuchsiella alkaliacetigena]|uniref:Fic family protein n=1 Tax=Fuchsiella alkaliacetigena TaxID=957042 RepID=UPI00200B74BC|nr:Fic family protein [Fuchsiella alkaliacetigena]MCK8824874.1 Fic family protein [Fuchsiella alkaliacetigena]